MEGDVIAVTSAIRIVIAGTSVLALEAQVTSAVRLDPIAVVSAVRGGVGVTSAIVLEEV